MMRAIKAHDKAAQFACPSPQDFIDAFGEAKSVFVVTMTAALSGTYNFKWKQKNYSKKKLKPALFIFLTLKARQWKRNYDSR